MTTTPTLTPAQSRRSAAAVLGHDISSAKNLTDALALAGLDWTVRLVPASDVPIPDADGSGNTTLMDCPGRRFAVRSDKPIILGVAGSRYAELQHDTFFALGQVAHEVAGAEWTFGGELDHGRRVFMQMRIPNGDVLIGGQDLLTTQIRLTTTHDGRGAHLSIVTTRLACTNGMHVAFPGMSLVTKITHTRSVREQVTKAKEYVKDAMRHAKAMSALGAEMLDTPMTLQEFCDVADSIWPEPQHLDEQYKVTRAWKTWSERRKGLCDLYAFGQTTEVGRGTAWGAFNTLTEWSDWGTVVRDGAGVGREAARARRQFDLDSTRPTRYARALVGSAVLTA